MREGVLPAAVIAAAVVGFVAYLSFQGSSHAVDFAVTGSDLAVVDAGDPRLGTGWQRRVGDGQAMLVDVAWAAGDSIAAGSYAVLVTVPRGWRHLGCRPECEWTTDDGLREFGARLRHRPYRLAATFEAEQTGDVRVAFRSPRSAARQPAAPVVWLLQTNGDDVLGAEQVPLG